MTHPLFSFVVLTYLGLLSEQGNPHRHYWDEETIFVQEEYISKNGRYNGAGMGFSLEVHTETWHERKQVRNSVQERPQQSFSVESFTKKEIDLFTLPVQD